MLAEIRQWTGRPVLMLVGGFHLLNSSGEAIDRTLANFKAQGVRYVGPTHCTGDAAIDTVRQSWRERFVEGGGGTTVQVAPFVRSKVR